MEEMPWELDYREPVSGQNGSKEGEKEVFQATRRHRVDRACIWETTDR